MLVGVRRPRLAMDPGMTFKELMGWCMSAHPGVSRPSRERGRSRSRRGSPSRSRAQHLADSGDRSLGAEGAEREARGGGVKGKLLGSMTAREKEPPTGVGGNAA
ncbi:hypothetical protein HPP92_003423 [Vanilla planifolia]|uniref:Uncharacterized protein n=1 Tax=Vanilla planifolia TaxID=51239 RepID=A0A835S747_VANPL|nr:hypothetical protein HPP92_003423 [Vanilla planifolia]